MISKSVLSITIFISLVCLSNAFIKLDIDKFNQDALSAHNAYRNMHNVEPLEFNEDLSVMAQSIANLRALDDSYVTKLPKYNGVVVGGNVCQTVDNATDSLGTGEMATNSWYDGIADYVAGLKNINSKDFAQLVWKSSRKVGFGIAKSRSNGHFVAVGLYYPAGNIEGEFEKNVILTKSKI